MQLFVEYFARDSELERDDEAQIVVKCESVSERAITTTKNVWAHLQSLDPQSQVAYRSTQCQGDLHIVRMQYGLPGLSGRLKDGETDFRLLISAR